ncbi:hypothetical protein DICVIV_00245 [Dictyocaulus viviparus]|uniref:Uncharacterized protein n=1 Tax=Dictyocaulus viviparus TaxID=29172 RepID=A0A0D8YBB8_DICVI|nr:hypothetical protein DICVIV_00245 [Dictyocaulus viviparus]
MRFYIVRVFHQQKKFLTAVDFEDILDLHLLSEKMVDGDVLEVQSGVVKGETSEVRFKMTRSDAAEMSPRKFQSSNMEATLRRTPTWD